MEDKDFLALTHYGEDNSDYFGAVVPPVFLNSLHLFDTFEDYAKFDSTAKNSYVYGRVSNPTVRILEDKLANLENGTRAAVFSSGMAAATAAISATCGAGSHIICIKDSYQPVKRFLNTVAIPRLNMTVTYVAGTDLEEIKEAITPNTHLIILESPATFVFTVLDLMGIVAIAKEKGIKTYIDNSCCTPLFQKPLDMGIDIVMHTMSKYIGGHSDIIGGVLVSKDEKIMDTVINEMREWYGGIIGPMEGWLAIRGLRTLHARLMQHQDTGLAVAEYLEKHNKVERVYYTGLDSHPQRELVLKQQTGHTGLMSFQLDTSIDKTVEFINNLKLFGIGCSWGGFESLALAPLYNASKEELDFLELPKGRKLVRIHCGLEGKDNLLADIEQALKRI